MLMHFCAKYYSNLFFVPFRTHNEIPIFVIDLKHQFEGAPAQNIYT